MSSESRANLEEVDLTQRVGEDRLAAMLGSWSEGSGPLHSQLSQALGGLVEQGVLRHGDVLPPERRLAAALNVSRGTVVKVYSHLAETGLVVRKQGSGTIVSTSPVSPASSDGAQVSGLLFERNTQSLELLVAVPKSTPRALDIVSNVDLASHAQYLDTDEPAGIAPLRERIAQHITEGGLPTRPSQVLVTSGAQQGIALANQLFVRPGEYVLTEAWTWPAAIDGVTSRGGRVHGCAMDEHGIIPELLREDIEKFRPTMIAINPHHHNPTGTRLSEARRNEVAQLAAEYGVVLVEDRANAYLAFDGQVAPPFGAYGHSGQEVIVDSLCKVSWPGFRVGWMRADAQVIAKARPLRAMMDLYSPVTMQIAAIDVLDAWADFVDERVAQIHQRCDALFDACAEFLPDWQAARPRGGLVSWWELPFGVASEFATFAARYGVLVASGNQFGAYLSDDTHIRLPFTSTEAQLIEGVRRLGLAWTDYTAAAA